MMLGRQRVSAADANRRFSDLLRQVREDGRSFVVTSHGRPVARLVPFDAHDRTTRAGRRTLLRRLEGQPAIEAGRWTREELYEE